MKLYKKNKENKRNKSKGQVLTEYVVLLCMFTGVVLTLLLLLTAFHEYGWRLISLVGLEYP